jgi:hypothetical protein
LQQLLALRAQKQDQLDAAERRALEIEEQQQVGNSLDPSLGSGKRQPSGCSFVDMAGYPGGDGAPVDVMVVSSSDGTSWYGQ